MPQQTKIFRVFVSSTFTDMTQERRILQRDAFPRLEKFCEERGAKFQAVDLRWGVNEESALNQKTLQICFNEIVRCQKISPRPNFLILLGDKYGWQPIPEISPGTEMTAIEAALDKVGLGLIRKWYWLDENAIPAEFVLQSRGTDYKDYHDWEPVETEIRNTLRAVVGKLGFSPEQLIKYFASATHQEIIRGALNPDQQAVEPAEQVFAFSRRINNLPNDGSAKGYIDLLNGRPDAESKIKLDELKVKLHQKLGADHYSGYDGYWKDGTLSFQEGDLQKFNDKVYTQLEAIITEQLAKVVDKDEINHEERLHEEFKERLTEHFRGRQETIDDILRYINDPSEKRVLALVGDSGSGKSSVMAQVIKLTASSSSIKAFRFIGTTSNSSNVTSMLRILCGQIAREFGVTIESLAGEGREQSIYDIQGLTDILRKCLALATVEKPILVFLDALDQLSETDNAKSFYWLPRELPKHARMIVSSITELEKSLSSAKIIHLPILPEQEARVILGIWLASAKRSLTEQQNEQIFTQFNETKLPIYLKLAFEKAKHWHSYDEPHPIKSDVAGIINDYFDDLQKDYPKDFVETVVCYMLSGRYQGLTENEILEILAFDEDYWKKFINETHEDHQKELIDLKAELENGKPRGYMKIPISVWSRLFFDLEPFLAERDADGVPIITFFHRQFNEVLRGRYGI
ncbi:MAG: AAA family ATPase [Bacteroidota bacterium]